MHQIGVILCTITWIQLHLILRFFHYFLMFVSHCFGSHHIDVWCTMQSTLNANGFIPHHRPIIGSFFSVAFAWAYGFSMYVWHGFSIKNLILLISLEISSRLGLGKAKVLHYRQLYGWSQKAAIIFHKQREKNNDTELQKRNCNPFSFWHRLKLRDYLKNILLSHFFSACKKGFETNKIVNVYIVSDASVPPL